MADFANTPPNAAAANAQPGQVTAYPPIPDHKPDAPPNVMTIGRDATLLAPGMKPGDSRFPQTTAQDLFDTSHRKYWK